MAGVQKWFTWHSYMPLLIICSFLRICRLQPLCRVDGVCRCAWLSAWMGQGQGASRWPHDNRPVGA